MYTAHERWWKFLYFNCLHTLWNALPPFSLMGREMRFYLWHLADHLTTILELPSISRGNNSSPSLKTLCHSVVFQCPDVARTLPNPSTSGGWFGIGDFSLNLCLCPYSFIIISFLYMLYILFLSPSLSPRS